MIMANKKRLECRVSLRYWVGSKEKTMCILSLFSVREPSCRRVLAKGVIVSQPYTTAKNKCRCVRGIFGLWRQHQMIVEERLGLRLLKRQIRVNRPHRSTFLPATICETNFAKPGETPSPTTNSWSAKARAEGWSTIATATWPEFREGPPRKLAVQDASERVDIAAAANVETNHGTIIDEDETALPAHGWVIIVAGVSEHGDIAGTPPIVAEAIELLPGDSVEDKTLARSAAMAAWTVCEINATISDSKIVALIPLSSNSDCDLLYVEHEVIYWKRNRTRYCDDTTGDSNTAKPAKSTARAGNVIEMIDLNKSAVKLLEPR